jgi:hypothetical protein
MHDVDAALCGGLKVDRGILQGRRSDQTELWQALDDRARHRRALAHHADDVERLKAGDDSVGIGHVVVEHGYVRALIKPRPVRHGNGYILVIVEHGDPDGLGSIRHGLLRRTV